MSASIATAIFAMVSGGVAGARRCSTSSPARWLRSSPAAVSVAEAAARQQAPATLATVATPDGAIESASGRSGRGSGRTRASSRARTNGGEREREDAARNDTI